MDKQEILSIIKNYGINDYDEKKEIDTSNGDDYRLNIILDKKYVLRINGDAITEDRLASIDRLAERYREMGLLAPKLYKTGAGKYISKHNQYVCYISEYIDLQSLEEKEDEVFEILGDSVVVEVRDKITGKVYRRELPIDFYENANVLRLLGENQDGSLSEMVFYSERGVQRLKDITGSGADRDLKGHHH